MMAKDNLKRAIIVTTLTFGIGHILNLFNGADLVPTLIQVCYALAVGYLFVTILINGKSLWPCIITHSLVNSLSIFGVGSGVLYNIVGPILIIVISWLYVRQIKKIR